MKPIELLDLMHRDYLHNEKISDNDKSILTAPQRRMDKRFAELKAMLVKQEESVSKPKKLDMLYDNIMQADMKDMEWHILTAYVRKNGNTLDIGNIALEDK